MYGERGCSVLKQEPHELRRRVLCRKHAPAHALWRIHSHEVHVPSQLSEETSSASPPVAPTDPNRAANFNWNSTRNGAGFPGTGLFTNLGAR